MFAQGCSPTNDQKKDDSTTPPPTEQKQDTPPALPPLADKPKDGDDVAVLDTSMGKIVIMFYLDRAPKNVGNFMKLANDGVYNGTRFHRCMPGFMVQGGDPLSKDMSKADAWGSGGNEYTAPDEFNDIDHVRGIVSMANTGQPNSGGCQFFIVVKDSSFLNGHYSAFGKVVQGMDVADKIVATGPTDQNLNGKVDPKKAVLLKSVKIEKWPVK